MKVGFKILKSFFFLKVFDILELKILILVVSGTIFPVYKLLKYWGRRKA